MSHKKLFKSSSLSPTSTTNDIAASPSSHSLDLSSSSSLRRSFRSSQEMSASAAASAAAIAMALDLKPKHQASEPMQQQQKIKKCAFTSTNRKSYFNNKNRPLTRSLDKKLKPTPPPPPSSQSQNNKALISCETLYKRNCNKKLKILSSLNRKGRKIKTISCNNTTTSTSPSSPPLSANVLTKEQFLLTLDLLAVVRRNASDKLKLIQMVHDNPILWDSRLPNFKGAEEEKNRAWEMIGKEFNAPGRRVARAFKSLRESYRRELAHVKLMGNNFKPKWSLYEAMDFLRDVIRERKGGAHAIEHSGPLGLSLSALAQHISNAGNGNLNINNNNNNNNHNNNNNNISNINNNSSSNTNKNNYKLNSMHSSFNDSALNLSKCSSSLNVSGDDYYYYVKSELDLSNQNTNPNVATASAVAAVAAVQQQALAAAMASNLTPAHQQQQQHHQHQFHTSQQSQLHQHQEHTSQLHQQSQLHNDSRVSSTRNDTSAQNNTFDDLDNSSERSGDENTTAMSNQGSDEVEELDAIDADFPYPLILNSNSPTTSGVNGLNGTMASNGIGGPPNLKRRRKHLNSNGGEEDNEGEDDEDDEDDYEGQMLQQHRHLRAQNMANGLAHNGLMTGGIMGDIMPPPQTVREVLNSKFCGFISAKLNSMEDSEADNLMNKILMLLVQTQMNTSPLTAAMAGRQSSSNNSTSPSSPMMLVNNGSEGK